MTKNIPAPTHTELFRALTLQLITLGLTPDQVAGYLLAEETHGCLRPNAPGWLMKSTIFRIERGECPSMDRLHDLKRICSALDQLEDIRQAVHDVDGF
jgi:hypothetical protein